MRPPGNATRCGSREIGKMRLSSPLSMKESTQNAAPWKCLLLGKESKCNERHHHDQLFSITWNAVTSMASSSPGSDCRRQSSRISSFSCAFVNTSEPPHGNLGDCIRNATGRESDCSSRENTDDVYRCSPGEGASSDHFQIFNRTHKQTPTAVREVSHLGA